MTRKEDIVAGAVETFLDPGRLKRISTRSRGIIRYVAKCDLPKKMLEQLKYAECLNIGGYDHLLLVQWFIKVVSALT